MENRYYPSGEVKRYAVRLGATLQRRGGSRSVTLVNLSADGCCFLVGRMTMKVGDEISIQTLLGETLHGTVKWRKGVRAGVHFAEPLKKSTVDRLGRFDGRSAAVSVARARLDDERVFTQPIS
jgi:hypothetical protein